MDRATLMQAITRRDFSFLEPVSSRQYPNILKLGNGYCYILGLSLLEAGNTELARSFFSAGFTHDVPPYNLLCLEELSRIGTAEQRYAALEAWQQLAESSFGTLYTDGFFLPPDLANDSIGTARGELLLALGKYTEFPDGIADWYAERQLSEGMTRLFPEILQLSSAEAGTALSKYGVDVPVFDRTTRARIDLGKRQYQASWAVFRELLENRSAYLFTRFVLSDACKAALYGGTAVDADFLRSLSDSLPAQTLASGSDGTARFLLSFYSARILHKNRSAGTGDLADVLYGEAISRAESEKDYDTAVWYLLDYLQTDRSAFLQAVGVYAPLWHDASWYSDVLDAFIVRGVQLRDWKSLGMLKLALSGRADPSTEARLSYLCARTGGGGVFEGKKSDRDFYMEAFEGDHDSLYYRFLSANELGMSIGSYAPGNREHVVEASGAVSTPAADAGDDTAADAGDAAAETAADAGDDTAADTDDAGDLFTEDFLAAFVEAGLYRQLYSVLARCKTVSPERAIRLSEALAHAGQHELALRTAILGLRRSDGPVTDALLKQVYPRPWLDAVSASATHFGLGEDVVYALLRSESFFRPDVVSSAGAIGLSQLMPATAGDIARKLKTTGYDLNDPATNITFGVYYLAELAGRLDGNMLEALFSYNAGITRVRSWKKTFGNVYPDLFLESVPYSETREYGRKVLAAAAVYGYLYYQKSAEQTVREIFR